MTAMQELLKELETIAKAMPGDGDADDAKIRAAAGEEKGEEKGEKEETEEERKEREEREAEDAKGEEAMGKSFTAVVDGKEVEAIDGTELVKSLMARIDTGETDMAKALGTAVSLLKATTTKLDSQGNEIALLKSQIAEIGNQGTGRRTILNINEKPVAGINDKGPEITPETIMAKATAAADQGVITYRQAAFIDGSLRAGQLPDRGLLTKIGIVQ